MTPPLSIARQVFSYTNHTVMGEALEKWDMELLRSRGAGDLFHSGAHRCPLRKQEHPDRNLFII